MKENFFRIAIWAAITTIGILTFSMLLLHGSKRKEHSLQYMLHTGDLFSIGQYGTDQNGNLIAGPGIATLSRHKNPRLFSILKNSAGFHSQSPLRPPDYIFIVQVYKLDRYSRLYKYVTATGELGTDHEWCYVPNEFKVWMQTLPKPHHARYKTTKTWWYEAIQQVN